MLSCTVSLLIVKLDPLVLPTAAAPAAQNTNSKVTLDEHKLKSRYKKVHLLTAGDYFGHQVCLHWSKSAIFTAVADDYTELLTIGGRFLVRFYQVCSKLIFVKQLHISLVCTL